MYSLIRVTRWSATIYQLLVEVRRREVCCIVVRKSCLFWRSPMVTHSWLTADRSLSSSFRLH